MSAQEFSSSTTLSSSSNEGRDEETNYESFQDKRASSVVLDSSSTPPLDLPTPPLDLPLPEKEIPAHVHTEEHHHHNQENYIKTLLAWSAPGRPFKKKSREYFLSGLLITLLIEVILFLFSQYPLMLVVLSINFVAFALAIVPPSNFHYRISEEGITIEDHFFLWQELYDFYFKKRNGIDVLHIRTKALIPGELTLTLGGLDRNHLLSVLLPFLPFREMVKPTFMEKSGDWLVKNFPLERPHPSSEKVAS